MVLKNSNRSSIHKILGDQTQANLPNKYDTEPCKFISEINCQAISPSTDSKIKLNNFLNIKASRDDYSIIQKNDVYERISKIKFSLTSIFDNIYEKCNGKIAEFSFCEEIENSKEFNPKLSYRRFESMLSQISNIISEYCVENMSGFEMNIKHKQNISPESGTTERKCQDNENEAKIKEENETTGIHKTKLNKSIHKIKLQTKHIKACFSQSANKFCQYFNLNDEKQLRNDYDSLKEKKNFKAFESGTSSKMHKFRLMNSTLEGNDCKSDISSFVKFKELRNIGSDNSDAYKSSVKFIENNFSMKKQNTNNLNNEVYPISLIQTYFSLGIRGKYEA